MNLEIPDVVTYTEDLFAIHTNHGEKSQFDLCLESLWQEGLAKGYFRYGLENVRTRHLGGKYGFIAQLNIKRAIERRKPQFISDVVMPFDQNIFHFGKISKHEILFQLNPLHWIEENDHEQSKTSNTNVLIINVSPLEYCHSLLVPSIEKCYPQVLTFNGLRLALETLLISYNPALRIGFNSLGAYASVNHLHFHIYYLQHQLFLQYAPTKHLIGECYELECFPSRGFVFQLLEKKNVVSVVRSVMKLVEFLIRKRIAHNIFMTRGSAFADCSVERRNCVNVIRIYVWAREATFGSKNDMLFNPAVCELGGHLPIKDEIYFETVTEEEVSVILQGVCSRVFNEVKEHIWEIYEKN